jgi:hypothetical protein
LLSTPLFPSFSPCSAYSCLCRSPCIGSSAADVRKDRCRRSPCIGSSAACVRTDCCRRSPCILSSAACVRNNCCRRSPYIGSSADCVRNDLSRQSPCRGPQMGQVGQYIPCICCAAPRAGIVLASLPAAVASSSAWMRRLGRMALLQSARGPSTMRGCSRRWA